MVEEVTGQGGGERVRKAERKEMGEQESKRSQKSEIKRWGGGRRGMGKRIYVSADQPVAIYCSFNKSV